MYAVRVRIGVLLLLLFAAASIPQRIRAASAAAGAPPDPQGIAAYEARFQGVKADLSSGVVGYLSEPMPNGVSRDESREYFKHYVLAQYALVPVLVARAADYDLVVGNFHSPAAAAAADTADLILLRDYGGGIMLFRR